MIVAARADGAAVVRRDPLAELRPPHLPLLEALGLVPGKALARRASPSTSTTPQRCCAPPRPCSPKDAAEAFAAWCEVARLHTSATALPRVSRTRRHGVGVDVRDLLVLRRATLGDREGLRGLPVDEDTGRAGRLIVLCADPDDEDRAEFLRYTWRRLPPDFVVWTTGAPGSAQARVAGEEGVTLRLADGDDPRGSALAIWRTIVAAGRDPATVRVVALPARRPRRS